MVDCVLKPCVEVLWRTVVLCLMSVLPLALVGQATVTDRTRQLQAEIDAAWASGGGTVSVPPGDWLLCGVRLRSHVRLLLQEGAHIWSTRDAEDYADVLARDPVEPLDADSPIFRKLTSRWNCAIIRVFGATDVEIVGEKDSFVDGRNCFDSKGEEGYRGPHALWVAASTNVSVRGMTFRNAGNWATRFWECRDLRFDDLTVLGGHDGVHFDACDNVRVVNCRLFTGDDSIAGQANTDVVVSNCVVNSACSPFRLGGRDVLVCDCRVIGPALYPHRWTLTDEEKARGAGPDEVGGRRTTGCFFQPYADKGVRSELKPGNILFRNVEVTNVQRFMVYLGGLGAIWQGGAGFDEIRFENVNVSGIARPSVLVAAKESPLRLVFRNCRFAFREPVESAFLAEGVQIVSENVTVEKVGGRFCEYREGIGYADVPEFPSWRIETPETRKQWGL